MYPFDPPAYRHADADADSKAESKVYGNIDDDVLIKLRDTAVAAKGVAYCRFLFSFGVLQFFGLVWFACDFEFRF